MHITFTFITDKQTEDTIALKQRRIQKFGMGGGKVGVRSGKGHSPLPRKFVKILGKIMHFRAKFYLF